MRGGEMAALKEVPFGLYYGSVDATPLFVMLADAYERRTGDLNTVRAIWPAVQQALSWLDRHGDRDGDGFVEYARRSEHGLVQQGWKDSHDAIFHADGADAEPPIALCEVQGYTYAAKHGAARLADRLGDEDLAAQLAREAEWLRLRFEETFWCEDLGTYALALDGAKRPCRVRTSNPGHCLFTGIASRERALRTAETLMDASSLSGWGIRTVAAGESRYNPMSYHNGSVWPHDTALAAAGMARYGLRRPAVELLAALLDASTHLDLHRMPELFCGFHRRSGEGPILYPVACAPQSWAAASVFLLMQSCLGLTVEGGERRVVFDRPMLPECIPWMRLQDLRVGDAAVDLQLVRHDDQVLVEVLRKEGDVALQVLV
jgi:glycogen debranching enzyme